MLLESYLQLTTKILVEWVVFADDVTLEICMDLAIICDVPATSVGVSSCRHSSMVVLFTNFCAY